MARILFLEPYCGGSHKAFAEGLARHSGHEIELVTLPGRFWKWRMRGSAPLFARTLEGRESPDLLLASSMLPLAEFLGLAGEPLRRPPRVLYFHENQLTYPLGEGERRDLHLVMTQVASGMAADRILFNSRYHREEFLHALPGFLRALPDRRPAGLPALFRERSSVIPPGVDFATLSRSRPPREEGAPPTLLWNHRWEHDKGRDLLLGLVRRLRESRAEFRLIVTGAPEGARSDLFEELPEAAGPHLVHVGFAKTRAAYAKLLASADLVVSTARHEFFGISILEAIHAGAFPLLPRALAYPEILPPDRFPSCYWGDQDELFAKARAYLMAGTPRHPALGGVPDRFAWPEVAPRFDRLFDEVLSLSA
ncbi:MAG: DUF3524 domain-containing protein [Candidatus Eisenbacteria bacterium]